MKNASPKAVRIQHSSSIPSQSKPPLPNTDRISNLPDPILHHIVDFLPIKYAIRTSVLSKRFEAVWLNSSTLDLNENQYLKYVVIKDNDKTPREMFLDRLRRCYERHNLQLLGKLKIHAKQIINKNVYNDLFLLIDLLLIEVAKGSSIKEMDLKFPTPDEPQIFEDAKPRMFHESFYGVSKYQLFSWHKTLKTLKLKGCSFIAFEYVGSDDIKFPFLKELFISNCLITDVLIPHLINWCPELEDLTMQYLLPVQTIQFSHPKLNRLTIGCYRSSTMLQIDVPSLLEFEFKGTPWLYFWGGLKSEEVRFYPHHVINAPNLESLFVKYARVYPLSIRKAMTTLKNIKKVVFQWCFFPRVPRFWAENLERLMISDCEFEAGEGRLGFYEARFPKLKFLILCSCRRLKEIVIHCPRLAKLVLKECHDLRRYSLIEPSRQFKFIDT